MSALKKSTWSDKGLEAVRELDRIIGGTGVELSMGVCKNISHYFNNKLP